MTRVTTSGRVFMRDGQRWFWMADTSWKLWVKGTREEIADYLDKRAAQGFNAVQAVALWDGQSNAYGDSPGSPSNPNDDYFQHVDYTVQQAAQRGMVVVFLPAWAAHEILSESDAFGYGQYLANRYAADENIIWMLGGDHSASGEEQTWRNLADGLDAGPAGSQNIQTYHPIGRASSIEWFNGDDWVDYHCIQTGAYTGWSIARDLEDDTYVSIGGLPWINGEPFYEDHNINWDNSQGWATAIYSRRDAYWAVLAGAAGHTYGCWPVVHFARFDGDPYDGVHGPYQEWMNTEAANQMRHVRALFESRPRLEPDDTLVSDPGSTGSTDYTAAAIADDNSTLVAYLPEGGSREIDLAALSGSRARPYWFNPRTGAVTQLADRDSSGTQSFSTPTGEDWVLVVDDVDAGYPEPGTADDGGEEPPPTGGGEPTFGDTIGSGGFRFYDANHEVSHNYVEGVYGGNYQGPMLLDSGDAEGDSSNLAGHWRVVNALVERNVIVDCPEGVRFGHNYDLAPSGCTVRDNLVARTEDGRAVTELIAPVNTTVSGNDYHATPEAAGLVRDPALVWRRPGYGPRLTYLQAADVGVDGDPGDADGTGALISGGGDGGGDDPDDPPPPGTGDPDTAAGRYGWGAPLAVSDEFDYTGVPDPARWKLPGADWAGHAGNGTRDPERVEVRDGRLIMTGLANGSSGWMEHQYGQQYGRWEVRCRSYALEASNGNDYHPVLIVWPDSNNWPEDGEYDFCENGAPGEQAAESFLHYPHDPDVSVQQEHFQKDGVDLTQWHNFGFEWAPDGLTLYCDGEQWGHASGGGNDIRRDIQDMPSGHGTVQLDNFDGTNQTPAVFEVEWYRVYTLTPSGPINQPQSVTAIGIGTAERFGFPTVAGDTTPPPTGSHPTLLGTDDSVLGQMTLGYTVDGDDDPPPSGGKTVSQAGAIRSRELFGLPLVEADDGPQTVRVLAIDPATTFGRPVVDVELPPGAAPGGVLVPAVYAVGRDGVTLTPLPAWSKLRVSPVRNSMGSISIDCPSGVDGFTTLHDEVSAYPLHALEVRIWLGGNATGALGGWLIQKSGDDLTPGATWTFTGHFHEWLLSKALIAPQPLDDANPDGELRFEAATAGLVLTTIMDQAQARGALPLVTRDFTAEHDSNGLPWPTTISSFSLAPKTTLLQVADKLFELGMIEFELTAARVWRAYVPGTRGVDRTTGASPLTFAHAVNLREHARRESAKDAGTAVLAAGAEGFYSWADSATAVAELGWRAEVGADAGQLESASAVQAFAATYLESIRQGVAEHTGRVEFGPSDPLPLIDWGIGDWAYTWVGQTRRKLRVAQIVLEFAKGGVPPKGTVTLNDLITDRVSELYKRLNRISSGDAVVGTSTPTPGGTGEDRMPPAAPTGLTLASELAYQVPGETATLAVVSAGWSPVLTDAYPDTATAGKAEAAPLIAERIRSGQPIHEDWTWDNAPAVVQTWNDALLEEFEQAFPGVVLPTFPEQWLRNYPAAHLGGGAVTGDVDHYRLQYRYLGLQNVTDPGTGAAVPEDTTWVEPTESPTRSTSLTFGNIEGGRTLGVRVAAVDRSDNQGPWSAVVAVDTAADDKPPPVPSAPIGSVWFRTADWYWDGKGASGEDMLAAAPDFASGGYIELHVAEGIDFIPDRPIGSDGKVDLSLSSTFVKQLLGAGTWNQPGLNIGTTYFARFVAVDRNGNASDPSATSNGVRPQQLVQIDIGPGAVGRLQIIDGEIVRAKIALAAVGSAQIEEVSAGLISAGTMNARVVIGGRFETPVSNGNQIQFDNAGIRLYQGGAVVGRWQVSDASMLVTGTYMSALNGERINILPDGSFRLYGAAGVDYASIQNAGGIVRMRSRADSSGRRSYVDFDPTQLMVRYGTATETRTSFHTGMSYGVLTAAVVGTRVDQRFRAEDDTEFRAFWVFSNNGQPSGDQGQSVLHYLFPEGHAALTAPVTMVGLNFNNTSGGIGDGTLYVTDGLGLTDFDNRRHLEARSVVTDDPIGTRSTRRIKRDIRDAIDDLPTTRFRDIVRGVKVKSWKPLRRPTPARQVRLPGGQVVDQPADPGEDAPRTFGFVAEELQAVAPELVHSDRSPDALPVLYPMEIAAVAWQAAAEAHDDIDELRARLADLETSLRRTDGGLA